MLDRPQFERPSEYALQQLTLRDIEKRIAHHTGAQRAYEQVHQQLAKRAQYEFMNQDDPTGSLAKALRECARDAEYLAYNEEAYRVALTSEVESRAAAAAAPQQEVCKWPSCADSDGCHYADEEGCPHRAAATPDAAERG